MPEITESGDGQDGVTAELHGLAKSSHPEDRAAAGRQLAPRAGSDQVDELLLELLLDQSNTFVTYETAEALLERRTPQAARVVAKAVALADPRDLPIEWLGDAVNDVWLQKTDDVRTATSITVELCSDPDATVRDGAEKLRVRIESGDWPRSHEPPSADRGSWRSRLMRRTRRRRPNAP
ncbi:hypothetical protein GCM10010531_23470 [Blastococcus jejuensis]|uniref:HEAT repeat domain-containing protein n=1 Tax=Blastococcus jejuensis TaxID=351224 RepID=A0ABP6P6W7_9ACTN